jgi:hypothetical protein
MDRFPGKSVREEARERALEVEIERLREERGDALARLRGTTLDVSFTLKCLTHAAQGADRAGAYTPKMTARVADFVTDALNGLADIVSDLEYAEGRKIDEDAAENLMAERSV